MQYITQCSSTRDVITTSLPTNNYLLSQIVKEQPKCLLISKKHQSTSHRCDADCCFLHFLSPPALRPAFLVEPTGIEPVTSCLQSRRSPS